MTVPNITYTSNTAKIIPQLGHDLSNFVVYRDDANSVYQILTNVLEAGMNMSIIYTDANNTVTLESSGGGGGGGSFDLFAGVGTETSTLAGSDRFVIADVSIAGEPNRYITANTLSSFVVSREAVFNRVDQIFESGDGIVVAATAANNTVILSTSALTALQAANNSSTAQGTVSGQSLAEAVSIRRVYDRLTSVLGEGDGITIQFSAANNTVLITRQPDTEANIYERVRDILEEGANITLNEDDTTNRITITATGGGGGGTNVVVNPTGAATEEAVTLQVDTTIYSLPDDVIDVTDTGLPALTEANHKQLFIDHDTPRVWVGHREVTAATPAQGTFTNYSATNYRGALALNGFSPSGVQAGWFWYDTVLHTWIRARSDTIPVTTPFSVLFPNSDWLGEQPNDATAVGLIDSFDTSRSYYFYDSGTNRVRVLTNSTYVAGVTREVHYTAEPISSPATVGTIAGITAGVGLTGGGTSGVVTINIDPTEADFPTIPIDKGGTGSTTNIDALTALDVASFFAQLTGATFTGAVSGITPTDDEHFTTKAYVDGSAGGGGAAFQLRSGDGVPANTLGADGDWYIDILGNSFFQRVSGAYVARLDLGGSVHIATSTLQAGTGRITLTTTEDVHIEDLVIFPCPGAILSSSELQARVGTSGTLERVNFVNGNQAMLRLRAGQTMCLLRNATSWTMVLPDRASFAASDITYDSSTSSVVTSDDIQGAVEELDTAVDNATTTESTVFNFNEDIFVPGSNIDIVANNQNNRITISSTGTGGTGNVYSNFLDTITSGNNIILSPNGEDGTVGVSSRIFRGNFSSTATYNTGDVVEISGQHYICLSDGITNDSPLSGANAVDWAHLQNGGIIDHSSTALLRYNPGTVVQVGAGATQVFICRRPTTDAPSTESGNWFFMPRGGVSFLASVTARQYRSENIVFVGQDVYYCHTSTFNATPNEVTAAQIAAGDSRFTLLSTSESGVFSQTENILVAGSGISLVANTQSNRITIVATGGGNIPTHTAEQYLGIAPDETDHTFVPGDFSGALGEAFATGSHTVTAPTYTGNRHFAIARLESDPDLTYLDAGNFGQNQIGAMTKQTATITIGGAAYEVWKSNQRVNISGEAVEAR